MFVLSLFLTFRLALMIIVAQSLGMGWDAPRGRVVAIAYNAKTKGLQNVKKNIKVAVMGCIVNGPGEAKEADLGVAGGIGEGLIIKKGEIFKKVPEDQLLDALRYELENWSK